MLVEKIPGLDNLRKLHDKITGTISKWETRLAHQSKMVEVRAAMSDSAQGVTMKLGHLSSAGRARALMYAGTVDRMEVETKHAQHTQEKINDGLSEHKLALQKLEGVIEELSNQMQAYLQHSNAADGDIDIDDTINMLQTLSKLPEMVDELARQFDEIVHQAEENLALTPRPETRAVAPQRSSATVAARDELEVAHDFEVIEVADAEDATSDTITATGNPEVSWFLTFINQALDWMRSIVSTIMPKTKISAVEADHRPPPLHNGGLVAMPSLAFTSVVAPTVLLPADRAQADGVSVTNTASSAHLAMPSM